MCDIYLNFSKGVKARQINPSQNPSGIWKIGRSPTSDIVFNPMETSREHALLRSDDGQWEILDLNTPNGTRINGDKIPPRQWVSLNESDRVEFGHVDSRFVVSFIKDDTLSGYVEEEPITTFGGDDDDDSISGLTYAGAVVRLIERAPTWRLVLVVVAFLVGLAIVLIVR